jgi:hypothetical protein
MSKILKNNTASEIMIADVGISVPASGQIIVDPNDYLRLQTSDDMVVLISNSSLTVNDGNQDLPIAEATSYIQGGFSKSINIREVSPLNSNIDSTGKKLFSRVTGLSKVVVLAGQTHVFNYEIPYIECKFDEVEIIGCKMHDTAVLKILDTTDPAHANSYSGVSNFQLNQFGFSVNLCDGFHVFEGKYPSTLVQGLIISVEYTNLSGSDTSVSLNLRLHELKSS